MVCSKNGKLHHPPAFWRFAGESFLVDAMIGRDYGHFWAKTRQAMCEEESRREQLI